MVVGLPDTVSAGGQVCDGQDECMRLRLLDQQVWSLVSNLFFFSCSTMSRCSSRPF